MKTIKCKCGTELFDCDEVGHEHYTIPGPYFESTWHVLELYYRCPKCFEVSKRVEKERIL